MKRLVDLALILLSLPLTVPIAVVVAVMVRVNLGKGILFRQTRAGLNGKAFEIVKFRTMLDGDAPDAERLTRFGKFLRTSSLDEIPELWNVIKGEMSLVGPRPLPIRYLPRYSLEQNRRHEVLPGITGWAQVHGRNALDWETKFRYDVEYVNNRSLYLDLKILLMTIFQVVSHRGISHEGEATMSEFLV